MRSLLALPRTALLLVLALGFALVAPIPTGAEDLTSTQRACDDERPWTSETLSDGECVVTNLCSPEAIVLAIEEPSPDDTTDSAVLNWTWTFPASCPMDAIDAMGVLAEHRRPLDPGGDLSLGSAIVLDGFGTIAPAAVGGGSLEVTCGYVSLEFTVLAGEELVATAFGSAFTNECPATEVAVPEQSVVGSFTGSSGDVGAFARLYWVVYGRVPDRAGFGYWLARTQTGLTLQGAADIWTQLPEWIENYDDTTDAEFLDAIYQNVLGRTPDVSGFDYWLGRLDDGLSRSELAVLFSDAAEFRERTATG